MREQQGGECLEDGQLEASSLHNESDVGRKRGRLLSKSYPRNFGQEHRGT